MTNLHNIGTEIYYTGDMANQSGFGVITAHRAGGNYGSPSMDILMEDGREMFAIHMANFGRHPGRRFWTKAEYMMDRQQKIDQMRAEYEARMARRAAEVA
jgi:hypothetical protein